MNYYQKQMLPTVVYVATYEEYLQVLGHSNPVMIIGAEGRAQADIKNNVRVDVFAWGDDNYFLALGNEKVDMTFLGGEGNVAILEGNFEAHLSAWQGDVSGYFWDNAYASATLAGEAKGTVGMYDNAIANVYYGEAPADAIGSGNVFFAASGGGGGSVGAWYNQSAVVSLSGGPSAVEAYHNDYTFIESSGPSRVTIEGDAGQFADVRLGDHDDVATVEGFIRTFMSGGRGNDILLGGRGEDVLEGGRGNDVLAGGEGPDVLDGGRGDDLLIIDRGDIAYGGAGADSFAFRFGPNADNVGKIELPDFNGWEGDRLDLRSAGIERSDVFFTPEGSAFVYNQDKGVGMLFEGPIGGPESVIVAQPVHHELMA